MVNALLNLTGHIFHFSSYALMIAALAGLVVRPASAGLVGWLTWMSWVLLVISLVI